MTRIDLSPAERDLLAVLCDAAIDYYRSGMNETPKIYRNFYPADWELLNTLNEKLAVPEPPEHPVMRLNW